VEQAVLGHRAVVNRRRWVALLTQHRLFQAGAEGSKEIYVR